MIHSGDTVVAIATPPGRGALGIVRVSGPQAGCIARAVLGSVPEPRQAAFRRFRDAQGEVIDEGIALIFRAPASFTGEDTLELHAHGSPQALDRIVETITRLGARPADPGEFSHRAFLNGKYDLIQLEAIADLINSASAAAARCAQRSVQGEFSERIARIDEALAGLRVQAEAALDFADEDIVVSSREEMSAKLGALSSQIERLQQRATQGARLLSGGEIVIAGQPNVGKSSLLNQLAGRAEAIVSATAGTTRDIVGRDVMLGRLPVRVLDTAGLRKSEDKIEREGVRRARAACREADLVLVVTDIRQGVGTPEKTLQEELDEGKVAWITVYNKHDLMPQFDPGAGWCVSAKTGSGIERLSMHICQLLEGGDAALADADDAIVARRRHLAALEAASAAISRAIDCQQAGFDELMAEELKLAQSALDGVTGTHTTEALLGDIFSSFCIGK